MPTITQSIDLDYSIDTLWKIVHPFDNWITLIPGYITHHFYNENEFTLSLKANYGILKKTVNLKVNITKLIKPSILEFDFRSESKHLKGEGYLQTIKIDDLHTKILISLVISANGAMAPVIHSMIKNANSKKTKKLTSNMLDKILENQTKNKV